MNEIKIMNALDSCWHLHKKVVHKLGLDCAMFLAVVMDKQMYDDGWVDLTIEEFEGVSGLSRHQQDQCIKKLQSANVLKKEVRGIPPKRYFKIDYE